MISCLGYALKCLRIFHSLLLPQRRSFLESQQALTKAHTATILTTQLTQFSSLKRTALYSQRWLPSDLSSTQRLATTSSHDSRPPNPTAASSPLQSDSKASRTPSANTVAQLLLASQRKIKRSSKHCNASQPAHFPHLDRHPRSISRRTQHQSKLLKQNLRLPCAPRKWPRKDRSAVSRMNSTE